MSLLPTHRIATACLLCGLASPALALDLTVNIHGASSSKGEVSLAVFSNAASRLTEGQAAQDARAKAAPEVCIVLRGLSPGRYALTAYHDENGNRRLDTNLLGVPKEAYGFSRGARPRLRSAEFDEAALDLQSDQTIDIRLD